MKTLILILSLFATAASAQIDATQLVTRDGTRQYRDTSFWLFTSCCSPVMLQADLVQIRGNVRTVTLSSGPLTRQSFGEWLQAERDRVHSEINTLENAIRDTKERHRALQLKIQER